MSTTLGKSHSTEVAPGVIFTLGPVGNDLDGFSESPLLAFCQHSAPDSPPGCFWSLRISHVLYFVCLRSSFHSHQKCFKIFWTACAPAFVYPQLNRRALGLAPYLLTYVLPAWVAPRWPHDTVTANEMQVEVPEDHVSSQIVKTVSVKIRPFDLERQQPSCRLECQAW